MIRYNKNNINTIQTFFESDPTPYITANLRNSTTSGNISSITDELNTNPAVQSTDNLRPSGNADLSMNFSSKVLQWPISASNFDTNYLTFACWIKTPLSSADRTIFSIRSTSGGASASSVFFKVQAAETLCVDINVNDASNVRRAQTANSIILDNIPQFVTLELNMTKLTDLEKVTISVNGYTKQLFLSNPTGSPSSFGSSLVNATGNYLIGANNSVGTSSPMTGIIGRDIFISTLHISTATQGNLTQAARINLMNILPLV